MKRNSYKKCENSEIWQIGQQFRPIRWRQNYSKAHYYDIAMWTIIICAEDALRLRVLWFSDWHAVFKADNFSKLEIVLTLHNRPRYLPRMFNLKQILVKWTVNYSNNSACLLLVNHLFNPGFSVPRNSYYAEHCKVVWTGEGSCLECVAISLTRLLGFDHLTRFARPSPFTSHYLQFAFQSWLIHSRTENIYLWCSLISLKKIKICCQKRATYKKNRS
jgi:hypothetical protein